MIRHLSYVFALSLLTAIAIGTGGAARAVVCPAIGADSDCGAIITITDSGSSISFTGQGPYDGIEDTLVGVVNNSNQPIYAMGLKSPSGIFGFDGDGISSYGAPGNSQDSTGYGGPNAYFTNIDAGARSGVVNFVNPLPAKGGNTYFSLEEALSSPKSIQDIINNSITVTLGGRFNGTAFGLLNLFRPTNISATFKPNGGLTLAEAAQQTGFINFDWQQTITNLPGPSVFHQAGNPVALTTPPGFLDPPPGGYDYCVAQGWTACQISYPFYPTTRTADTLDFFDSPRDSALPSGSAISFTTDLIGILPGFAAGTDCLHLSMPTCIDLGVGFNWTSSYNGSFGGIAVTASNQPIDPSIADGLGGTSIVGIRQITDYSPLTITTVNGNPVGLPPQSAVPEPSTYAMMITSFFILGSISRKKKSRKDEIFGTK